ncbi:MAG: SdiA-regulated domain-containing protein [bacterium]
MIYKYIPTIVILFGFMSCSENSVVPHEPEIKRVDIFSLEITEPSGVALSYDKTQLWIVGDQASKIYLTDLEGDIDDEINVGQNDMEGIAIISDSLIAAVIEETREVIFMTPKGKHKRTVQTGLTGEFNHGFEGITFVPGENVLFIANEKNPELILKMDLNGNTVSQTTINFETDVADLYYDDERNVLWILSQESSTIYKCDLEFNLLTQFTLPTKNFEGIAVSENLIYLVSDSENELWIYEIIE